MLFQPHSSPHSSPTSKSPRASPPASPKKPLSISNVANIFIQMRHAHNRAKANHIESSSEGPHTHLILTGEGATCERKVSIAREDIFICTGGVDVSMLLRASRASLMETAELAGANALVDEEWTCTVCGPKHRANGTFRVHIRYSASATRSERRDPHKPVALDQVRNIPGLMTIIKRTE